MQAIHRSIKYFGYAILELFRINNFPRCHCVGHGERILEKRHRRIFLVGSWFAGE